MADVNILGVGMAQFPDEMPTGEIRSFLQSKFPPIQDVAGVAQPSIADPFAADRFQMQQRQQELQEFQQRQFPDPTIQEPGLGEVIIPGLEDTPADIAFTAKAIEEGDVFGAGIGVAGTLLPGVSAAKLGAVAALIGKKAKPIKVKEGNDFLFDFDPNELKITELDFKDISKFQGDPSVPITVTKKNGDFIILDGHHRAKIAKAQGNQVRAVVIPTEDVEEMISNRIHQGDMLKEWIATGGPKKGLK